MNKLKLFIDNFLVYGLGGIISKVIPLLMVPIVTRLMPSTDYFGISDLSNTVVNFFCSVAIMGMYDAMYRLFFDKDDDEYKKAVCSTTFTFTLVSSIVVFLFMFLLRNVIAEYFFSDKKYAYVVYISAMATLVGATNGIISAPTRMQNKRRLFLIANTLGPILSYSISIPLLLKGFYVIALPLAALISSAFIEFMFGYLNIGWFSFKYFDKKLLKPLLLIAIPLFPNFLVYWLFNSCDKVMITNMIGIGAAGIYSVGSKLGNCSQLIYTAFAGGWQYFAFSTMKEDNQVKNNSAIFEYLGIISFVATALVTVLSSLFFKLLFTEQYYEGFIVAPYLFLAPLLLMLFQVACNQFIVVKKTWPNILILSCGAFFNVIFNFTLIPILGIEGAAIATLMGYIIADIVCSIVLIKMKLMVIEKKFIFSVVLMLLFLLIWRMIILENTVIGLAVASCFTVAWLFLYRIDIIKFVGLIRYRAKDSE